MNVFSVFPEYDEVTIKVAQALDSDDAVFALDDDSEGIADMVPGDFFQNRDDDRLYKVASIAPNEETGNIIVQASNDFSLDPEEFGVLMNKVAGMDDKEKRHMFADSLMAHTFKQVAPKYAHAVGEFESMGKWYA
jgi:hypothetical protein